ncbi:hypothetical protein FCM96_01810 [Mycoplasma bovis]|uniref:hypothetical protein n=1 Tax=Mycoplasmopsis bovis TaxID=28903 RepID=UPI001BDEE31D|nr:hypothetical protein [Mycoplasmopsis bovis]MBT1345594.1 hypothetical protein [Mycoplasmopsis bovis]MBT1355807.1 hypothetical protein [Mycoplasmopsis bovis]MBT1386471.1 hypothetical protein [Mycoplasmopsis bovis]MBT1395647.1 hypothetical protein [Mycoplasmopsis bovis]MBT1418727.1 hypothetical protein [Mycoplasmopsis bovis]
MKSKFLMTLPALISLPIISATCTNVNQGNSSSETKKPNANNKSQNDKIIVHNGSTNKDDNKSENNSAVNDKIIVHNGSTNKDDNKINNDQQPNNKSEDNSVVNDEKLNESMLAQLAQLKEQLSKLKQHKESLEKILKDNEQTEKDLKKVWEDIENGDPNKYDDTKMKEAYDKWLKVYEKIANANDELEILKKSKKIEEIEEAIKKLENKKR